MTSIDPHAVGADSISARSFGHLRVSCGPGVPGPYGLLFPVQKFSKNNLANARIICYDNKLKTCSVPKGHGHIEQRESF